ncbi:MAG: hypothetical protein PHQ05_13210 [Sterolibacterium sp.]|nr:hypothetical protein [Sterolibacterium sp.]
MKPGVGPLGLVRSVPKETAAVNEDHKRIIDEIAKRTFYAVCKAIAGDLSDGNHATLVEGFDPEGLGPEVSRALTENEVNAAAQMALWVEESAKALAVQLLTEGNAVIKMLAVEWAKASSDAKKYSKGLKANNGRIKGGETQRKKAAENRAKLTTAITDILKNPKSASWNDSLIATFLIEKGATLKKTALRNLAKSVRAEYVSQQAS